MCRREGFRQVHIVDWGHKMLISERSERAITSPANRLEDGATAGFLVTRNSQQEVPAPTSDFEYRRRKVVALFCDPRVFTTFADTAVAEDFLALMHKYYDCLGPLIAHHKGSVYQHVGDGLMLLFNDGEPCPDAPLRATRLAIEMRSAVRELVLQLDPEGGRLGFGIGIAEGHAVFAQVGCEGGRVCTAIGRAINLASRLCCEALDGQILVSGRVASAIEDQVRLESLGRRRLRGFSDLVTISNVPTDQRSVSSPRS